MQGDADTGLIQPTVSLQCFFKERLEIVFEKHEIDRNDDTLWYLTRLLCDYSNASRFLDHNGTRSTLTPLAEYYRMALESNTKHERRQQLQRLGDVAIVVASLFSGALKKKPIGVDYYIAMGESAYATLAEETTCSSRERALQFIFETLANEFSDYVVAMSEVPARVDHQKDLLQLVDEWQQNKHPGIAKQLRQKGVILTNELNTADNEILVH
ncbi:MAG: hypothetical protein KTR32_08890 [Granulosicoccus sp.]|nr:hypothetical protein [Granulosicoccus sp.]